MKALVCFFSKTGNTRKVAQALFETLPCQKDLLALEAVPGLEGYDLVFLGFPVWELGPAGPALEFLENKVAGARLALFVTHAMPSEGDPGVRKLLDRILGRCRRSAQGAQVLGLFHCRGALSAETAEQLEASGHPALQHFARSRDETLAHPDQADLEGARDFARQMLLDAGA